MSLLHLSQTRGLPQRVLALLREIAELVSRMSQVYNPPWVFITLFVVSPIYITQCGGLSDPNMRLFICWCLSPWLPPIHLGKWSQKVAYRKSRTLQIYIPCQTPSPSATWPLFDLECHLIHLKLEKWCSVIKEFLNTCKNTWTVRA